MSTLSIEKLKAEGHSIVYGTHGLAEFSERLAANEFSGVKLFILADENTLEHCLPKLVMKVPPLVNAQVVEVPAGENSKTIEICQRVWEALDDLGADRTTVLVNLGGGVVGDLGGFVAATFKRGIRFFQIPTSLLAQVDASIGGKVGVNHGGLKNQVGLFAFPQGVYIDPDFLETLPREHLIGGFAEMIKHALIASPAYWKQIKEVSFFDIETLRNAIWRSVEIKQSIVAKDPKEGELRKALNFGHTLGHALESYSLESDVRTLNHGEAVAAGMICEAFISHRLRLLDKEALRDITSFIFSHFSKIKIEQAVYHRIVELMRHDKKNFDDQIRMTLLAGIGEAMVNKAVRADMIIESLNYYQRWVG